MTARSFVHLHCHSHYSLLDGANRIPELVARTKALGMNALALTDHGNLYGAIEFYRECKDAGINPVIGYEAYVSPGKRTDREARRRGDAGYHLTLLAQNRVGFKNLTKMASVAFLEGYHYVPRIDKDLLAAHSEGIICLSGCASGEFSELILKNQMEEATRLAEWFAKLFGKRFYVEIQNNGLEIQRQCAEGAIEVADRLGLPLVATCDAHYLCQGDASAHDVLLCINTGKTRNDENRMRYGSDQFYVRAPAEMYQLFADHADAVQRSQEIADSVCIELDFKARHFPVFTPPNKKKPENYLRELCEKGLRERYGDPPPQAALDRLNHELDIICRMGFASYFLIVWDFVRFALEKNIPASARGSACGAIVSYALKLSHVDPLQYDLLFERFLDPNRSEAPDIDIDFCQNNRDKVIAYVREKYGAESVAQIATFGTMAARAAVRDVGRVLDVPLARVDQIAKMIPQVVDMELDKALKQNPDLKKEYESDPVVRELIDIARKLEGTNRNAGTHAAGVVIGNGPLTDYVPLQRVVPKNEAGARQEGVVITTQWPMGDLEKVGMLKMDFLGLRTLTLLGNAVRLIKKTRGKDIDVFQLPLDDKETFALLQRGDARGVFQFESDGIRDLLKRMRPDHIRDIIASTALYRPGPLGGGMVDAYVNRKHGREKPTYPHAVMEEILGETYGVMVYEEQVMRILNRLGGIELSSAYACIKAISKKKQEIIDERKVEFIKGAQGRGVSEETAKEIFDLITFFGGYGFNKCVVGETVVVDAATGERTTVASLFQDRRPFTVHALGEDGKLRPRRVTDVLSNGPKQVWRLRTIQGKEITATGNHPFWTLDGWKNLDDLRPGDRIGAPRRMNIPTTERWPEHAAIRPGQTSKDTVPAAIRRWVDEERKNAGLTWKALEATSGVSMKEFLGKGSARKLGFRRPTVSRLAAFFSSQRLAQAAASDIFWDRVISIEPAGVRETYDLTVEVDHNFVADGLIVHNSHSAAYALVSYQTAYLKAHFTPEFMAALLSSEIDDGNKRDILVQHIEDARRLGVPVRPPDVNAGDVEFDVADGQILFGLTAIKGLGRGAAADIVRARAEGGPFRDLFDFCERIDLRVVNRAAIEKLIKAGGFDSLTNRRAALTHVLPGALQAAGEFQEDRRHGQGNFFDAFEQAGPATPAARAAASLPDVPEWSESERLKNEKEALDFYFSSHPLAQHEDERRFSTHSIDQIANLAANQEVTIGGMLTQVRFQNTKKARNGNTRYVRCKLEDFSGAVECVMWPDDFVRYKDEFTEDRICFLKAAVERTREEPGLIISRVLSVEQAQRELTRGLMLGLTLGVHEPQHLEAIARVLQRAPGSCPVFLSLRDAAGKRTVLRANEEYRVNPGTVSIGELETILGSGRAKFTGAGNGNGRNAR